MMAEDLKTVLDTLGVKKAHFLGFSAAAIWRSNSH